MVDLLQLLGAFNTDSADEDIDGDGTVNVVDLLLLLANFGDPTCEAADVTPTWFDDSSDPAWSGTTWGSGVDYCTDAGLELCSYASYCPEGGGSPVVGGTKSGDKWSPLADGANRWVQVGTCE